MKVIYQINDLRIDEGRQIILGLCEPRKDTGSAFTEHSAEVARRSRLRHFSVDGIQGKMLPKTLEKRFLIT